MEPFGVTLLFLSLPITFLLTLIIFRVLYAILLKNVWNITVKSYRKHISSNFHTEVHKNQHYSYYDMSNIVGSYCSIIFKFWKCDFISFVKKEDLDLYNDILDYYKKEK